MAVIGTPEIQTLTKLIQSSKTTLLCFPEQGQIEWHPYGREFLVRGFVSKAVVVVAYDKLGIGKGLEEAVEIFNSLPVEGETIKITFDGKDLDAKKMGRADDEGSFIPSDS